MKANPEAEGEVGSNDGENNIPQLEPSVQRDPDEENEVEEEVAEEEEDDDDDDGGQGPPLVQEVEPTKGVALEQTDEIEEHDDEAEPGSAKADGETAENIVDNTKNGPEEEEEEEEYENEGNPAQIRLSTADDSNDDDQMEEGVDEEDSNENDANGKPSLKSKMGADREPRLIHPVGIRTRTTEKAEAASSDKEASIMTQKRSASLSSSDDGPKRKQGRSTSGQGEEQKGATDRTHDKYCWVCHKDGVYFNCKICPRSYHMRCICLLPHYPEPTLPEGDGTSKVCICPECVVVMNAEEVDKRHLTLSETANAEIMATTTTGASTVINAKELDHDYERVGNIDRSGVGLQPVKEMYTKVIEGVMNSVEEAFLDEGIPIEVYLELKQLWQSKLVAWNVIDPVVEPPERLRTGLSPPPLPSAPFVPADPQTNIPVEIAVNISDYGPECITIDVPFAYIHNGKLQEALVQPEIRSILKDKDRLYTLQSGILAAIERTSTDSNSAGSKPSEPTPVLTTSSMINSNNVTGQKTGNTNVGHGQGNEVAGPGPMSLSRQGKLPQSQPVPSKAKEPFIKIKSAVKQVKIKERTGHNGQDQSQLTKEEKPKKRGRPPKTSSSEVATTTTPGEKTSVRKGRPRTPSASKVKVKVIEDDVKTVAAAPKRKGRPPKQRKTTATVEEASIPSPVPVEVKDQAEPTASKTALILPPKKRGRAFMSGAFKDAPEPPETLKVTTSTSGLDVDRKIIVPKKRGRPAKAKPVSSSAHLDGGGGDSDSEDDDVDSDENDKDAPKSGPSVSAPADILSSINSDLAEVAKLYNKVRKTAGDSEGDDEEAAEDPQNTKTNTNGPAAATAASDSDEDDDGSDENEKDATKSGPSVSAPADILSSINSDLAEVAKLYNKVRKTAGDSEGDDEEAAEDPQQTKMKTNGPAATTADSDSDEDDEDNEDMNVQGTFDLEGLETVAEASIYCQYEKITRTRNKWKFYLKDGIMNLDGKDYLFQKAQGDAEW